jgi:hypothetical protein
MYERREEENYESRQPELLPRFGPSISRIKF